MVGFGSTECIWYILILSVLWGAFKSLLFALFRGLLEGNHEAIYSGLFCLRGDGCFCLISCQGFACVIFLGLVLSVISVSHPSLQRLFCEESSPYMVPRQFRCPQLACLCVFSLFNSLLSVSKGVVKSPKPCGYKEWFIGDQTAKILQRRTKCWESRFYVTVSRVGPLF